MLTEPDREQAREQLTDFERQLDAIDRKTQAAAQRIIEDTEIIEREKPQAEYLRLVVTGLRGLVAIGSEPNADVRLGDAAANGASPPVAPARTSGPSKMTYGGRPSIPAVILDVLGPYDASLDAIYHAVCAHDAFEGRKTPSRGSVTNRLNEMAERGEIVKVRRGAYKSLAPNGAAENPPEPGGPNPQDASRRGEAPQVVS